jgi:iron complex transport system ATP-binding protein
LNDVKIKPNGPENPPLLAVEGLCVGYTKPVLKDLSLEIRAGSFVSLLGPNGAGKTTLLRTLARRLTPLSGTINLKGRPLASYRSLELAKLISVVLTDRAAPPMLSVLEYVALGRFPHLSLMGKLTDWDIAAVEDALIAVKAELLADKQVDRLSDGERQKVAIARALAQAPELMLLDEPTAHLDLKHRLEVMTILRNICADRGLAVLAAIHDVDVAAKISDLVLTVRSGCLAAFGRPELVLSSEAVSGLYDLNQAGFSRHLGGVEVKGDGKAGQAFLLTRSDRSALAMRFLSKRGWGVKAGFLRPGDLDAHVAEALGGEVFWAFDESGPEAKAALDGAVRALSDCSMLVDCLAPESNALAKTLTEAARQRGILILTLEGTDLGPLLSELDRPRSDDRPENSIVTS